MERLQMTVGSSQRVLYADCYKYSEEWYCLRGGAVIDADMEYKVYYAYENERGELRLVLLASIPKSIGVELYVCRLLNVLCMYTPTCWSALARDCTRCIFKRIDDLVEFLRRNNYVNDKAAPVRGILIDMIARIAKTEEVADSSACPCKPSNYDTCQK